MPHFNAHQKDIVPQALRMSRVLWMYKHHVLYCTAHLKSMTERMESVSPCQCIKAALQNVHSTDLISELLLEERINVQPSKETSSCH